MDLLIDIGNTNTAVAVSTKNAIKKRYFLHTNRKSIRPAALRRMFNVNLRRIDRIVISSVVPDFLAVLIKSLKAVFPSIKPCIVGKDIKVPIRVKYRKPSQVGADRLVVSFAASKIFGPPLLVIDFGTAVTFDFVGKDGAYEGGLIFPGLRLGLKSLASNTALLPRIVFMDQKGLIGKDTRSSMNKGVLLGYAALCDGIVRMFRKKYGGKVRVVATGGDSLIISRHSEVINIVRKDLLFKGLIFLANQS